MRQKVCQEIIRLYHTPKCKPSLVYLRRIILTLTLALALAALGSYLCLCPFHQLLFARGRGVDVVKNLLHSLLTNVLSHPDESFYSASVQIGRALQEDLVAPYADIDGQLQVLNHHQDL